jgi:non-ribosomal peptide synthetase component F
MWDGYSNQLLCEQLCTAYDALEQGRAPQLPDLATTFAEFAEWQRKDLEGTRRDELLRFWIDEVRGAPAVDIPGDLTGALPAKADWLMFEIDAHVSERVDRLAAAHGITPFMWSLAAFDLLLARRSGARDLLVGAPVMYRLERGLQHTMGCLMTMLPFRIRLDDGVTVLQLAQQIRASATRVYQHQELPIELLVRKLRQSKSDRSDLHFNDVLSFQPPQQPSRTANNVSFAWSLTPNTEFASDFGLAIQPTPGGLQAMLEYDAAKYTRGFAERFGAQFSSCLGILTESLDAKVGSVLERLGAQTP